MKLAAHIRKDDLAVQTVDRHGAETAQLAMAWGKKIQAASMAELSGFLHDMGKWTDEFSKYLHKVVIEQERLSPYIDHSTAGARYLYENYYLSDKDKQQGIAKWAQNLVVEIVGMVILSHHSGLQDYIGEDGSSDFIRRVRDKELPYYEEVVHNFEQFPGNVERVKRLIQQSVEEMVSILKVLQQRQRDLKPYPLMLSLGFVMKTVFSCLIDADRSGTRRFEEKDETSLKEDIPSFFRQSYKHLLDQVHVWEQADNKRPIDHLRSRMSRQCEEWANLPSGIYSLSIPTGGGKTFASLRYALKHALEAGKAHIIYVVPYKTILEQNADAVRKIIRNQTAVLEHHGNVIDDKLLDHDFDYYGQPLHKQLQLARDNWDYPIVFTTMVQFLDAFYAKGTRKVRRLHHLMNSVIIFDEVQSVPFQHYHLFNEAVNFLHYFGQSSILLCTATQPAVADMRYPLHLTAKHEMVSELEEVVAAFERVQFHLEDHALAGMDQHQLADYVAGLYEQHTSLLVILNTKKSVQQLFEAMMDRGASHVYHLSTLMCPAHRTVILDEVKDRLHKGKPVLCISTQLIEAGVDISFQAVLRAIAGLDSIAQAAGRCNRHGEKALGDVYMVDVVDEHLTRLPEIQHGKTVTIDYILSDPVHRQQLQHPDTMRLYYQYYYHVLQQRNRMTHPKLQRELIELIDENRPMREYQQTIMPAMYKTLETHFQAIDSPTTMILVPYGRGKTLITELNDEQCDLVQLQDLIKEAQHYSINIFSQTLHELSQAGLIYPLYAGSMYYLDQQAYNDQYGLSVTASGSAALYAF